MLKLRTLTGLCVLSSAILGIVVAGCEVQSGMGPSASSRNGGDGDDGDDQTSGANGRKEENKTGLPCDVKTVFEQKCQLCHGAETTYGASVSLVTTADLTKEFKGKKVAELVKARIHDANRPMPPVTAPALSEDERSILTKWIDGGMKAGDGDDKSCNASGGPKNDVPRLSCQPNVTLAAKKPFTMAQGGPADQYICFGIDITSDKKKHLVGFGPKIDNKKILHHILVFEAKESVSPDPVPCNAFQQSWKLITGWAPGGTAFETPPEAGIPLNQGTTHYAVQLHYNNASNLAGQTDNSGFELCSTDTLRANDAGVLAFGSLKIDIPPRSTKTVTCDYELDERFQGATFFGVSPHMHKKGMSIGTQRLPGGTGAPSPVFVQDKFDFENQSNNKINVKVNAKDVFRTSCVFKNPSDQTTKFGENTEDEMCFNFMTYYPLVPDKAGLLGQPVGKRLPGGGFNWVTPSIEGCGLTLQELSQLSGL